MAYAQAVNWTRSFIMGPPGLAWAARRSVFEAHGFYDRQIIGGADATISWAMYGYAGLWPGRGRQHAYYSPAQVSDVSRWSERFHADVRASVFHARGSVFHLWH